MTNRFRCALTHCHIDPTDTTIVLTIQLSMEANQSRIIDGPVVQNEAFATLISLSLTQFTTVVQTRVVFFLG